MLSNPPLTVIYLKQNKNKIAQAASQKAWTLNFHARMIFG
jgi:hypothetical protein